MDISDIKASLEKYHRSSYSWALSCCRRDPIEAEEVLQTVYLKILEGKARFRAEATFKTWLFAVIRKTAADRRRRNRLRKLKLLQSVERAAMPISRQEGPEDSFHRSETQSLFRRRLFREMRQEDERAAPPFVRDWEVARSQTGKLRSHHYLLRFAAAAGMLCAAALTAFILLRENPGHRIEPPAVASEPLLVSDLTAKQPARADSAPVSPIKKSLKPVRRPRVAGGRERASFPISMWQSPTASLLSSVSEEILKTVPRLDESLQEMRSAAPNRLN